VKVRLQLERFHGSICPQKTCAARHKGFHIVNVHASVKFIANFALSHMPNKLRDRVKFYATFDEIDVIEKKNLPKEYGGDVDLKEMTGNYMSI
jgi:hypothetical protein